MEWGLNDWDQTIGEITDTTPTTIAGSMYATMNYIYSQNPNITFIVFSTPFHKWSSGVFPSWATWTDNLNTMFKNWCDRYHVHFVDLSKWCNSWTVQNLVGDYVHPTIKGYQILANYISGQLTKLLGL